MIKYTLITLFTSVTLFFSAVLADGVVIDHNSPNQLNPGETAVVSVIINKGDVTGFAKLQLEIPQGLSVTALKKNGASFTFSGQKAKFIWMSLPDEQEFDIEYELTANPSASGSMAITGQFSYIKENERVDYELPTKVVNVGVALADNTEPAENSEDSASETDSGVIPISINTSTTAVCTRTISRISESEYYVELSSTGIETDGFAKLIEDISEGFEISSTESGESLATIEDDRIKFIWFEKPTDNTYNVSYSLISRDMNVKPEIKGVFSFIMDNQPQETKVINQEMISSRDFDEPTNMADNTAAIKKEKPVVIAEAPKKEEVAAIAENTPPKEVKTVTTTVKEAEPETASASKEVEEEALTATTVPDPEVGITYKVQLSATHKYITAEKFKTTHKFKETIQTENHEGWTKFVTGSHGIYKDARDARNGISTAYPKFKGPFVTAYNSGERITVQEALMISKQKWYQ